MKMNAFALPIGIALTALTCQVAYAHTSAWYSDHLEEARMRDKECQAKQKADIRLSSEEKSDCDNAVVALFTQRSNKPIPRATSAPAPKWKGFGH